MPHSNCVAQNVRAKLAQKQFRKRSSRNPRSRFSSRRAFEYVPRIVKIKLQRAGQIRVARASRRQRTLQIVAALGVFHWQRLLPVLPVAIFDAQRDRCADRLSVTHAGENLSLIFLNSLARAAPESKLTPVQFALNKFLIYCKPGGQAGNPGHQRLSVRLSGGNKSQHHSPIIPQADVPLARRKILPDTLTCVKRGSGPKRCRLANLESNWICKIRGLKVFCNS